MQIHERLISGLRSYAGFRLLTQVLSWAGTVYVVRHIGSHALGRYAIALVVFNYLSMAYDGTLLEALVQRPPDSLAARRAVFSLLVGVGLLLAALTAATSVLVAHLVGDAAVAPLIGGVALALALTCFGVLPQATLARQMAFPRLAMIGAVQAVCVTVTTVVLALRGAAAWALVAGLIVGAAVRAVLLNIAARGAVLPTWRMTAALPYVRFGGVLFADNVLWRWYTSLDTFLLGRWTGTLMLGYYNLAQQFAELPLEKISTVANDVSLPAYAELREDRAASRELLLETLRMHATAGFPIYWGLAAVAPLAVPVLFGVNWHPAIFPLIALAIVAPLRLIGSIETPAMTGLGRPGVLLKTKLIIAPCMTAALLVACRLGGINGAALAWLLAFPVCYLAAFRLVLQAGGLSYRQVLTVVRGPMLASAVMAVLVVAWQRLASLLSAPMVLVLATGIGIGALAYAAGLRAIDPTTFGLAQTRLGRLVGLHQVA